MDGSVAIGTGALSGGIATLQTSALLAGSHTITAVYSGDTEFNPITSSPVVHAITQVNIVINVTSTKNPSIYGDTIMFTVATTGSGVVPTGTVTIVDGTTNLGTLTFVLISRTNFSTNYVRALCATFRDFGAESLQPNAGN